MALGSSAPEILLAVIETVQTLETEPGELGPSTIVGSAAFNLLVITGISMISVPTGELRKIDDLGVFATTSFFCFFAYIWMIIVLKVWSPNEVEIAEAVLTLLFFVILIVLAFMADKWNELKKKKLAAKNKELGIKGIEPEEFYHIVQVQKDGTAKKNRNPKSQSDIEKKKMIDTIPGMESIGPQNDTLSGLDNMPSDIKIQSKSEKSKRMVEFMEGVKKDKYGNYDAESLAKKLKPQPVQERVLYNRGIGATLSGRKPIYNQIKNRSLKKLNTIKDNDNFGFNTLKYAIKEDKGPLHVKILNKRKRAGKVGIRTIEGTATDTLDYESINKILEFKNNEAYQSISIGIVDDDIVELDENFFVELFDPNTEKRLTGRDTITEVIVIDNDRPGIITFKDRLVKVSENEEFGEITLIRVEGSDGVIACRYFSKEKEDEFDSAKAGIDFHPVDGVIWFEHSEVIKTIRVPILKKGDNPERDDTFEIRIEKLVGEMEEELFRRKGAHPKFSKKNYCLVEITATLDFIESIEKVKAILDVEDQSWGTQFKYACMLAPTLSEDGIEEVSCLDAAMHFLTITWKLIFAFIPPRQMCGGWACFLASLAFIGAITAVVGEVATVFGCVIGMKPAATAITFVALGTSLPDTFASRQAAIESNTADASIGNVTGSNSVNVFLGLGLPWMIATVYNKVKYDKNYQIPAGSLSFSVMLYLAMSCCVFIIMISRRIFSGGELGGMNGSTKWLTGILCMFLWVFYIIFSLLEIYGVIVAPF